MIKVGGRLQSTIIIKEAPMCKTVSKDAVVLQNLLLSSSEISQNLSRDGPDGTVAPQLRRGPWEDDVSRESKLHGLLSQKAGSKGVHCLINLALACNLYRLSTFSSH